MKKTGILVLSVIVVTWLVVGLTRPRPAAPTTLHGSTMGTTYTVRMAQMLSADERGRWQQRIQGCLDSINARMSTYQSESEVSRFNRSTSTDWFPVSRDTALVVQASLEVSEQTGGAFDITIAPLVNLWNFGPDRRPLGVPSPADIAAAQAEVGYQRLNVRLDPPALLKENPELTVDLSGIAKGFAVDRVGELLEEGGVDAYMVEVGGEVRTRGRKRDGHPWRIGIERPVVGQRVLESVLELTDHALATSGDYRNFFRWEGVLYSHEIDPRSGRPVEHGVAAVSVLTSTAMRADAYATGLMVMPPDEAWGLADRMGLEIMMVTRDQQEYRQRLTQGFARVMSEAAK